MGVDLQAGRHLLDDPAPGCNCSIAGITPAGGIALSLFIGIVVGILGTVITQLVLRRRRDQLPVHRFPVTHPNPTYAHPPPSPTPVSEQRQIVPAPQAPGVSPLFSPLHNSVHVAKSTRATDSKAPSSHPSSTDIPIKPDQRPIAMIAPKPMRPSTAGSPVRSVANSPRPGSAPRSPARSPGPRPHSAAGEVSPQSMTVDLVNPFAEPEPAAQDSNPFLTPQATEASDSRPSSSAGRRVGVPLRSQSPSQHPTAAALGADRPSASELDTAYEAEQLDTDWLALMSDLDRRLQARGESGMSARERAIAIRKLIVATGTRGVDVAMQTAMEEVLAQRRK